MDCRLRRYRIGSSSCGRCASGFTKWGVLTGQAVWWAPFLIVALKWFWGVDAYKVFGAGFLAANVAFSHGFDSDGGVWYRGEIRGARGRVSGGAMADEWNWAGYNLNVARGYLEEVKEFSDS